MVPYMLLLVYTILLYTYECCCPPQGLLALPFTVFDCLTSFLLPLTENRLVSTCTITGDAIYMHSYIYTLYMCECGASLHSPHAYRVVYGLVRSYILPLTPFVHITHKHTMYLCYMQ